MAISISAVKRKDRNTVESSSAWPDASNTGPTGATTPITQGNISTNGTIIDGKSFTGGVEIRANNVTIRNCIIDGGYFCLDVYGTGCIIEDCILRNGVNAGVLMEASAANTTVRRCEITDCQDGLKPGGAGVVIQDNYFHDPKVEGVDPHNDGMQFYDATNVLIDHNWVHWVDTSCVSLFQGQGVWNNVTIQNNHLSLDTGGFLLYCGGTDGTNIKVLNNVMGNWTFGPATDWNASGTGNVWSGNTKASDGSTVVP